MQERQTRQREYQKTLQAREEILRFWKDRAKRNNERYERRPLDLGFDPSFCPIYAQCKRSQSFTPIIDERLRQIKSQMLAASGIRENSPLDMIFSIKGPGGAIWRSKCRLSRSNARRSTDAARRPVYEPSFAFLRRTRNVSGNCRLETEVSSFRPI